MASLAEIRFNAPVHHPNQLFEHATFNGPIFDSYATPSAGPSGNNQLDFLFYADQLINSFASKSGVSGDALLSGKARELMDLLPEMESLPVAPHSDVQAHYMGLGHNHLSAVDGASPEDPWGSLAQHIPTKAMGHVASLPYQPLHSTSRQQAVLPAMVKHQEWRLCVKAPTLGTFYLFTDPEKTVAEMIPDIESKIWELYHALVSVHLVQNDHGIDLPFSCIVSSVLEDRALVCVQYMRTDEVSTVTAFGCPQPVAEASSSPAAKSPGSSPSSQVHSPASGSPSSPGSSEQSTPQSPFLKSYSSPQHLSSGSAPSTPVSQSETDTGVKFREPPPAKVLQNKEFSFTVAAKNLKNAFVAFNNSLAYSGQHTGQLGNDASETGAYYAPIMGSTTNNPWGAPVPMPIDDSEEDNNCFNNFEIPIEVVVEEEGGGILHPRDYRIRCSVLDKQEGLYVFFVKLKKNSHYGRTRFIIKIRRKQPTRQERRLEYLETALLHNSNRDGQLRLGNDQGGRADLLVSHPIVVISKERKTKRKREKADQN